ncbi:hypothetical protein [Sphingobium lignivorans]|uniref:Uncharacterized protein n=1 Tax=Sphingobium lignivorans TaxID=2735886 RepID=A0ABR6NF69_9SPHN|nr:hypothetical protein [Sphingobium lignivorans]MBB5985939.1 hypothetical protein [Sphingobium lignivorans]
MIRRIGHVMIAALIVLDIIACFVWLAPLYLLGLASRPNGRQLISAYTGRAAINGHRWALRLERVIDRVLGKGHCRQTAEAYAGFAD